MSTTVGGAQVPPATRTVAHWFGTALNPHNGVTYGFTMAGADPALETSTTITADLVPVNVVLCGQAFRGSDVAQPVLDSPVFTRNSYAAAPLATGPGGTSCARLAAICAGPGSPRFPAAVISAPRHRVLTTPGIALADVLGPCGQHLVAPTARAAGEGWLTP